MERRGRGQRQCSDISQVFDPLVLCSGMLGPKEAVAAFQHRLDHRSETESHTNNETDQKTHKKPAVLFHLFLSYLLKQFCYLNRSFK